MAVLTGSLAASPFGGLVCPQITPALHAYGLDYWPPHGIRSAGAAGAALTRVLPVSVNSRKLQGSVAKSYTEDYYDRIHIVPASLALGNLLSSQTRTISVWNAWRSQSVSLQSIARTNAEGIDLTGPEPPQTFAPLQQRDWTVGITLLGPPDIDATLSWVFANGAVAKAIITGTRVVVFAWAPDWSDGIRETLAWLTDLMQSPTGAEQRRALRATPRRSVEATVIVTERERVYADLALFAWGARRWALPIWWDVTWLSAPVEAGSPAIALDTTGMDYVVGGLAVLRGATAFDVEVVEIDQVRADGLDLVRPVQATWGIGSRVYPARLAQLSSQPQQTRRTDRATNLDVSFDITEPCDWPALDTLPMYRGAPVWEVPPDESTDLTAQYQRLLQTLDNSINAPVVTDLAGIGFFSQQHAFWQRARSDQDTLRRLLYALKGRWAAIWWPTFADDLTLAAPVGAGAITIDVAAVGYTRFGAPYGGRSDLRISLYDGTVYYRRILSAAGVGTDVERLTLDSALGAAIDLGDIQRISFLQLVRQDSDSIDLQHATDIDGLMTATTVVRSLRDDLEAAA